jgi:hypothetical protein
MQLIVTDGSGEIVSFSESRQEDYVSGMGSLTTRPLDITGEYNFLFLMGHWERDYTAPSNGTYKPYDPDNSPLTLMSAGLVDHRELVAGTNRIEITLYPITVDLEFKKSFSGQIYTPALTNGKPEVITLPWTDTFHPDKLDNNWQILGDDSPFEVTCKIKKNGAAGGLDILLQAEGKELTGQLTDANPRMVTTPGGTYEEFQGNGSSFYTSGWNMTPINLSGTGHSGYTDPTNLERKWDKAEALLTPTDAKKYSVNFNLDVYPFGKSADSAWTAVLGNGTYIIDAPPKWIIRNGINNELPNDQTNFKPTAEAPWGPAINGNGAIVFHRTVAQNSITQPGCGAWNFSPDGTPIIADGNTVSVSFRPDRVPNNWSADPIVLHSIEIYYAITPMIQNNQGGWNIPPEPELEDYILTTLYDDLDYYADWNPYRKPFTNEWPHTVERMGLHVLNEHFTILTITGDLDRFPAAKNQFNNGGGICVWVIKFYNGAIISVPLIIPSTGKAVYGGTVKDFSTFHTKENWGDNSPAVGINFPITVADSELKLAWPYHDRDYLGYYGY